MNLNTFMTMLCILSALSSLTTEVVKKMFVNSKFYNLYAIAVAFSIGAFGIEFYGTFFDATVIGLQNSILMGIGCSISSMVGYDKIKQTIVQLKGGN